MWEVTQDGSYYPKSILIGSCNELDTKQLLRKFYIAGYFIARSIYDNRLMNLPLSQVFYDLLLDRKQSLSDLSKLDHQRGSLFQTLQALAHTNADPASYDLYFYDPWNDN